MREEKEESSYFSIKLSGAQSEKKLFLPGRKWDEARQKGDKVVAWAAFCGESMALMMMMLVLVLRCHTSLIVVYNIYLLYCVNAFVFAFHSRTPCYSLVLSSTNTLSSFTVIITYYYPHHIILVKMLDWNRNRIILFKICCKYDWDYYCYELVSSKSTMPPRT